MRLDISIHADVMCIDGDTGKCRALIVDPLQRRLTHVAVREHGLTDSEWLVPIELVKETSERTISLNCRRGELHGLDPFVEGHFVDATYSSALGPPYEWANPLSVVFSERVPRGERVLHSHSWVEASDGPVGRVESVVVDEGDGRITHVVVRTHHFLSRQDVAVPAADVEGFRRDTVLLRLSREDVERLPHEPLHQAYLLPALRSDDQQLVPEGPTEAGAGDPDVDAAHVEAAHLLAEEVRIRLRARGFSDEQTLDWAKAFLRTEHSGGSGDFLRWIATKEQAAKPVEVK